MILGRAYRKLGRSREARKFLEQALHQSEKANDSTHVAWSLNYLADLYEDLRDFQGMKACLTESLKNILQRDVSEDQPIILISLARAYRLTGEPVAALRTAESALNVTRRQVHRPNEAEALEEYNAALAMAPKQRNDTS